MPMSGKGLVKLMEELGELCQIVAQPWLWMNTQESIRLLEDEIGDVIGAITFVVAAFSLNRSRIEVLSERGVRPIAPINEITKAAGGLIQTAAKRLAYPDAEVHPDGGELLSARLESGIAEMSAAIDCAVKCWRLDKEYIAMRAERKAALFFEWDRESGTLPTGLNHEGIPSQL